MTAAALTKFEQVYRTVRNRIEAGVYAPGQRLSFRELARELDISDIPVREAIHRLAAEGRVDYRPRQGVVVATVSREEVRELFLPGAILEGTITRLAARHLSPMLLEQLAANVAEQRAAAAADDTAGFTALNRQFHAEFFRLCPARQLVETHAGILARIDAQSGLDIFGSVPQRMAAAIDEHAELLRLLDARPLNLDRVEAFARRHKLRFLLAMVDGELAAEVRGADWTTAFEDDAP